MTKSNEILLMLGEAKDGTYFLPPSSRYMNTDPDETIRESEIRGAAEAEVPVMLNGKLAHKRVLVTGSDELRVVFIRESDL